MRAWPVILMLSAAACSAGSPAIPRSSPHPMRVFSANQCTDQIVLALLPPERIASVTWLSRDPEGSLMAAAARRVGVNHGLMEEVIAQKPDLVIAGIFTTTALRGLLKRLDYPLVEVEHANDIAGIRTITRQIAAAVGERARGEALIADMDRKLAALAKVPAVPIPVVAWDRTGFAAGKGTLFDAVLTAAGARSLVRDPMSLSYRRPDIEVLLQADPALLVQGGTGSRLAGAEPSALQHPLVQRYWGERTLLVPQAYYICGTPAIADAAIKLRRDLRAAATDRAAPALPIRETER